MGCFAVIGTLGPSCRDVETLVALLEAGMTAARVDLTVSFPSRLAPELDHASLCFATLLLWHMLTKISLMKRLQEPYW